LEENPIERLLIEAVAFEPRLLDRMVAEWPPERFRHPVYREIAATAVELAKAVGSPEPAAIAGALKDPSAAKAMADILNEGVGKPEFERQFEDCLGRLKHEAQVAETRRRYDEAVSGGDLSEQDRLERELFRLRSRGR
jgi:hypothetical protein